MKRTISLLIALLLMLSFAGCVKQEANDTPFPDPDWLNENTADGDNAPAPTNVSGGGGTSIQISGEYSVKKYQPLTLEITHYDGGFFSLDLPVGWKITTFSEYTGFGFHAFDPNEPAYKIFCYCQMGFFLKSQAAKEFYQRCNYTYQYFPVLTNTTTAGFFAAYPSYIRQLEPNAALGSLLNPEAHIFPDIYNAQAIESYPGFMQEMPYSFDNSIIRANFTSASGKQCEGLLSVQVVPTLNANAGSLDTGLIQGYGFMGIAAPDGKFGEVEAVLQKCLSTLSFTQAYLDEASRVVGRQTDQIIANAKSMQAAYDSYNAAWSARQTTYDILSQKRSDATLGYERLYDPSTGEIYQADSGFYDDYGKAAGLELIGDTSERYYLEPIDYVITR